MREVELGSVNCMTSRGTKSFSHMHYCMLYTVQISRFFSTRGMQYFEGSDIQHSQIVQYKMFY